MVIANKHLRAQQPDEVEEPGEVAEDLADATDPITVLGNKIHLRGVDTLHTDDIKEYVKSHFGVVDKIEWIDDTSANLVFVSESRAKEAIVALSVVEIEDPTALPVGEAVSAKSIEGKPEINLSLRFALSSDKKERGAALRSRYYLLHPEYDPEEKHRRQSDRPRYRNRNNDHYSRKRDEDGEQAFDASMYDDAPRQSGRRSMSRDGRHASYSRENRGKELFDDRGRDRNRSASPRRDDERDTVMGDDLFSNRDSARQVKVRLAAENSQKELFPSKTTSRGGQLDTLERAIGSAHLKEEDMPKIAAAIGDETGLSIKGTAKQSSSSDRGFAIKGAANARDLFPGKLGDTNSGKELFDSSKTKQRQKAQDLFG